MKKLKLFYSIGILDIQSFSTIKKKIKYSIYALAMLGLPCTAQTKISGVIIDNKSHWPLDSVVVQNIFSKEFALTDSIGNFSITIKTGEMLYVRRKGYENVQIRILNEKQPLFYKLHLDQKIPRLDVRGHLLPYQKDSLEYYELYASTLNGAKRGENNVSSGFSLDALSKQNRDRWAFQAMYEKWQGQKYVDYVFNDSLVKRITYLEGNDLKRFMSRYRPSYTFLRSATDYEYLEYIKRSYIQFQREEGY